MKTMLLSVLVVMAVLFVAAPAMADIIWDGSVDPTTVGYTLLPTASSPGTGGTLQTPVPFLINVSGDSAGTTTATPGISWQNTENVGIGFGYYRADNNGLTKAAGWQAEFRNQVVLMDSKVPVDYWGAMFAVSDDAGAVAILETGTSIQVWAGNYASYPNPLAQIAVDSGYHTVTIVSAPGSQQSTVWVDGVLGATLTRAFDNPAAPNQVTFGDASSGSSAMVNWDYVNVPEPSTLALLATGLFGLLCYAWRKRK
jgi:hypothetical protein